MAKTLDDAIALFRAGHSPRECEKLTGIQFMKIVRESKKRGVEKGDLISVRGKLDNPLIRTDTNIGYIYIIASIESESIWIEQWIRNSENS